MTRPRTRPRRLVGHISFVLLALGAGCGGGGTDEILIGGYMGLTGQTATFGESTRDGILMAVDEVNQAGGVAGKMIKLVIEDDQGRAEESATAVRKIINQDGVVAALGHIQSSCSLAAAPICQEAGVPMITPSSTNPKVTETGDYIFRVCFIDPFQGTVMAKFAYENKGIRQAATLRDVRNDYSVGLANFFITTFKGLGGTIVGDQSYSAGDSDFRAQLTALKAEKPEAIFIPGYYGDVGLIVRQAREMGIEVPLLGGDGWDSPELHALGQEALRNSFFSNHYSTDDQNPAVQRFVQAYKTRFGDVPDALAALGYDAAQFLVAGLRSMAEADPAAFASIVGPARAGEQARTERAQGRAKLRDALAAVSGLQGVTGSISVDEHRNAVKPAVVLAVKPSGGYEYVTTIEP